MRNLRWSAMRWWRTDLRPPRDATAVVQTEEPTPEPTAPPVDPYSRLGVPQQLNYPSTTLARVLDQTADRFADLPALDYEDQHWNYRELLSYVNRIAGGLAELGVRKGDRVVMTLPNCPEFIGAFFAVQKLGAVVVNAGPLVGRDDLATLIERTQPGLLIGLDLQAEMLMQAGAAEWRLRWLWVSLQQYQPAWKRVGYRVRLWQSHQHPTDPQAHTRFEVMLKTAPPRPPTVAPEPDDVAVLQLTGGTSGTLKIAMLTHRSLLANAVQVSIPARMHPGQARVLGLLPMFHVYGLTMCLTSTIYTGGVVQPQTRFSATKMLEAVLRFKPTVMCLVPAMADAFCDLIERRDPEPVRQALKHCIVISGSAPLNTATAHRFRRLTHVPILQGYGLTEASPVTHCNPPDDPHDNSIGVPLPDTQVRIASLDDPKTDVEPGQTGELLISGPQLFAGYFEDEENTRQMLSTDNRGCRWLHTGDVGYVDQDGFYYLVDRRKAMINHAGFKVWPAKVEQVLSRHPAVADVAVVGRADPVHTERVVALIVPREGEKLDERELRVLCRQHLATYEVPSRLEQVSELPRSALGKLLRHRLGDDAQGNGQAAQHRGTHNGDGKGRIAPASDEQEERS